jgi:hypothetical protein
LRPFHEPFGAESGINAPACGRLDFLEKQRSRFWCPNVENVQCAVAAGESVDAGELTRP